MDFPAGWQLSTIRETVTWTAITFTWSICAWANVNSVSTIPEALRETDSPALIQPYLGLSIGLMNEGDRSRVGGVPTQVKLTGSYRFDETPWIADAGIGFHSEFLTQPGAGSSSIQTLFTEFSGRYEFSNRWQLGAVWSTLIDNARRYRSNAGNLASFAGVQVLREFNWGESYLVRAGWRAQTDIGIGGESLNTIMAELQVSFGGIAPRGTAAIREPRLAPAVKVESAPLPNLDAGDDPAEVRSGPIHFEKQSTKLANDSKTYLKRLSKALSDNDHLFGGVEVIAAGGKNLSHGRAGRIAGSLKAAGLPPQKIHLQTHTRTHKSMEVPFELKFIDVRNVTALKNVVDSVKR